MPLAPKLDVARVGRRSSPRPSRSAGEPTRARRRSGDAHVHVGHRRARPRASCITFGAMSAVVPRDAGDDRDVAQRSRALAICRWRTSPSASPVECPSMFDRQARLLRREPRHVRRGSAARAPDSVLHGAAAVAEVPAGRLREDAAGQARPPAVDSDRLVAGEAQDLEGPRPRQRAPAPPAAPRRCRKSSCRGIAASGSSCSRAMA